MRSRWRFGWKMLRKTLILLVFLCVVSGNRVRRHLVFSEGSRLFFSVDLRDNLFDYSDLFAQVFGVKMDWELPDKTTYGSSQKRIQRRDLYHGVEHILRRQNLNETSCMRKFLCEASVILPKSNSFFAQLFEVIFSVEDGYIVDTYKINSSEKQCAEILKPTAENECPLSLMSIFFGREPDFDIFIK